MDWGCAGYSTCLACAGFDFSIALNKSSQSSITAGTRRPFCVPGVHGLQLSKNLQSAVIGNMLWPALSNSRSGHWRLFRTGPAAFPSFTRQGLVCGGLCGSAGGRSRQATQFWFLLCPIEQWGEDSRLFSPVVFESPGSHSKGEPSPTKLP